MAVMDACGVVWKILSGKWSRPRPGRAEQSVFRYGQVGLMFPPPLPDVSSTGFVSMKERTVCHVLLACARLQVEASASSQTQQVGPWPDSAVVVVVALTKRGS